MKIIYVPITVPFNVRSIFAIVILLVGALFWTFALFSNHWWEAYHNEPDAKRTIAFNTGLLYMERISCNYNEVLEMQLCDTSYTVFPKCKSDKTTSSGLWHDIGINVLTWCTGYKTRLASFGFGCIATLLAFFCVCCGFFREKYIGGLGAVLSAFSIASLIAFRIAHNKWYATDIAKFDSGISQVIEDKSSYERFSTGIYFAVLGTFCYILPTVLGLSLYCCAKDGDANKANHPPPVRVERVDSARSTHVTRDGDFVVAPRPGFERIRGGQGQQTVDYDVDDEINNEAIVPQRRGPAGGGNSGEMEMQNVPPNQTSPSDIL